MALTNMLSKVVKSPEPVKEVIKQWLSDVGLPQYFTPNKYGDEMDATDSIRKLLIILVDEWED